jgi:hypothetical protein
MNTQEKEIVAKFEKYMSERHAAAPPASILVPALDILKKDTTIKKIAPNKNIRIL